MAKPRWRSGTRPQPHHPPASTIAACTAARQAGDWEAACVAAGLRPSVDLAAVASSWGAAEARRLWEGLSQLAPDLMQQYLSSDYRGWNSYATAVLTDPDEAEGSKARTRGSAQPEAGLASRPTTSLDRRRVGARRCAS
ncbi:hypothetical protein AB0B31_14960 [Catellatospora citrea]|uniref:hypothetical protein n=1 Tax=Catellatospora citrea TaxID=53366 RepID=UPI0033F5A1B0